MKKYRILWFRGEDIPSLVEKIKEECKEVIRAGEKNNRENLVWEIADLLYFLNVLVVKNAISLERVCRELNRRKQKKLKQNLMPK